MPRTRTRTSRTPSDGRRSTRSDARPGLATRLGLDRPGRAAVVFALAFVLGLVLAAAWVATLPDVETVAPVAEAPDGLETAPVSAADSEPLPAPAADPAPAPEPRRQASQPAPAPPPPREPVRDDGFDPGEWQRVSPAPQPTAPTPGGPPAPEPGAAATPGIDQPARPLAEASAAPRYPARAVRRREQGEVLLAVDVDARGYPSGVSVARSSGSRDLDQAALEAVRGWRFEPARYQGRPVASRLQVPLSFSLE
ncbi:energy transducer TonB [Coralloluteibacterium stylophorae]|uniref:Protein TonB n=2 Tax=Coralloluteibacterium stylophorae TaxID=1776034 RepID=A0AAP2CBN4_9GAMM|nr:energy transducer TonB [Coralloluteibacterium stylophorae]MBS7457475.1 energy transducer TonB [Coralloluteibacterium stylophorae]